MLRSLDRVVSGALRGVGWALDSAGALLQVSPVYSDRLQPSLVSVSFAGKTPEEDTAGLTFLAPNANVIGDVSLGRGTVVWYGAVIRGDVNTIRIGENSLIGDRSMIHVARMAGDYPTVVGNHVHIGAGCTLHGCRVGDEAIVGDGATLLDGAVVEPRAMVAPGSLVPQGKVVKEGQVWAGMPASFLRELPAAELEAWAQQRAECREWARTHKIECDKNWMDLMEDAEYFYHKDTMNPEWGDFTVTRDEELRRSGHLENFGIPGEMLNKGPPNARS